MTGSSSFSTECMPKGFSGNPTQGINQSKNRCSARCLRPKTRSCTPPLVIPYTCATLFGSPLFDTRLSYLSTRHRPPRSRTAHNLRVWNTSGLPRPRGLKMYCGMDTQQVWSIVCARSTHGFTVVPRGIAKETKKKPPRIILPPSRLGIDRNPGASSTNSERSPLGSSRR